jgi:hypothetical protein
MQLIAVKPEKADRHRSVLNGNNNTRNTDYEVNIIVETFKRFVNPLIKMLIKLRNVTDTEYLSSGHWQIWPIVQ